MIRAVLFDAGNTLVQLDRARLAELLQEASLAPTEEAVLEAERVARRELLGGVREGSTGTEPELWRAYFARLLRGCGVPDALLDAVGGRLREAHRDFHFWTGVEEGTAEALQALLDEGYRVAVVSNADGRMEAALGRAGLMDYLEFVVDSAVVGVAKPDPRIFAEAARRMDLAAARCVYVGDLYHVDVVGARGAGMVPLLFDPLGVEERPDVPRVRRLAQIPGRIRARSGAGTT